MIGNPTHRGRSGMDAPGPKVGPGRHIQDCPAPASTTATTQKGGSETGTITTTTNDGPGENGPDVPDEATLAAIGKMKAKHLTRLRTQNRICLEQVLISDFLYL